MQFSSSTRPPAMDELTFAVGSLTTADEIEFSLKIQKKKWMRLNCRHATLAKHKTILTTCDVPCRRSSARPRSTWGIEHKQQIQPQMRTLIPTASSDAMRSKGQPTRYSHDESRSARPIYQEKRVECILCFLSLFDSCAIHCVSDKCRVILAEAFPDHSFLSIPFAVYIECAFLCIVRRSENSHCKWNSHHFFFGLIFCRARRAALLGKKE